MAPQAFYCVLLVRLGAASLLVVSAIILLSRSTITFLVVVVLLSTFIHHLRLPIGTDGSDHMNAIVLTTGAVVLLVNDPKIYVLGAVFIALQLSLSYAVAGVAKALSVEWRSGRSTSCILCTWTYGLPPVGEFLRSHPQLSRSVDWFVIAFEVSFPFAMFLPGRAWIAVLITGLIFHLFNALIMGLNTFLWAFASGYPPLVFAVFLFKYCRGHGVHL